MENNREIEKRTNPSREPFTDVSNTASSSSASLPNSRPKRKLKSKSKLVERGPDQNEAVTPSATTIVCLSRETVACSTAGPSDLNSISGDCSFLDGSEPTTVYKRRNTDTREHTTDPTSSAALSCPPQRRNIRQNKENKSKKGDGSLIRRAFSSAPSKRRKKTENFVLPEDFVREQREYFGKLDEEELLVEEADSE